MKLIKGINKQKIIKSWIYVSIFTIILYVSIWIYSFIFEQDKLAIDKYNFKQLEKAKLILDKVPNEKIEFYSYDNFNEIYKTDIKPAKNCYVFNDSNWDKPYIFWFQLESLIYRYIYFWKNYAYPSYSRHNDTVCFGEYSNWASGGCYNNKQSFIDTISNPCQD